MIRKAVRLRQAAWLATLKKIAIMVIAPTARPPSRNKKQKPGQSTRPGTSSAPEPTNSRIPTSIAAGFSDAPPARQSTHLCTQLPDTTSALGAPSRRSAKKYVTTEAIRLRKGIRHCFRGSRGDGLEVRRTKTAASGGVTLLPSDPGSGIFWQPNKPSRPLRHSPFPK